MSTDEAPIKPMTEAIIHSFGGNGIKYYKGLGPTDPKAELICHVLDGTKVTVTSSRRPVFKSSRFKWMYYFTHDGCSLTHVAGDKMLLVVNTSKCNCLLDVLMTQGCQCGGN